jgi:hypothetical protein
MECNSFTLSQLSITPEIVYVIYDFQQPASISWPTRYMMADGDDR